MPKNDPLPGPYRMNEEDGCAYRVEYETPNRYSFNHPQSGLRTFTLDPNREGAKLETPARVVLTDCFGGHEMTITKSAWEKWPLVEDGTTVDKDDDRR